ncbi:MAG TPA: hypothetical protein VF780_06080, partial [Nitrosospira sp.]
MKLPPISIPYPAYPAHIASFDEKFMPPGAPVRTFTYLFCVVSQLFKSLFYQILMAIRLMIKNLNVVK